MQQALGIDLSHWNSDPPKRSVDWAAVKAAGITFAFLKATEGTTFRDGRYVENYQGALANSVLMAPYHFWRWGSDPEKQAKHFYSTAPHSDLPPVVDVEDMSVPSGANVLPKLLPFLAAVEQEFGVPPIFYTFPYYLIERGNPNHPDLSRLLLWIAHYTVADQPKLPAAWQQWAFWQHTSKGSVPGVVGNVDLNRSRYSVAELHVLANKQPPEEPATQEIEIIVPAGITVKVTERPD